MPVTKAKSSYKTKAKTKTKQVSKATRATGYKRSKKAKGKKG